MHETVLIVEDDAEVGEFLETALRTHDYRVLRCAHADRALELVRQRRPDLVLLDLVLPGLSGWDLLRAIRREPDARHLPVVAMSARQKTAVDTATILYEGADDFIIKPFEPEVLLARIEAHLRRRSWQDETEPRRDWRESADGKIRLHLASRMLELRYGRQIQKRYDLTPKEFELLDLLLRREGEVLNRNLIREALWPANQDVYGRTVDKLIENIRKKLKFLSRRVETVSGIGYVLRPG